MTGLDHEPVVVSDEELTAEALAADPDAPIGEGAIPLHSSADRVRGRARRWLLGGIVVGLFVINGVGLCVTYGFPEIAW